MAHVDVDGLVAAEPHGRAHMPITDGRWLWSRCHASGRWRADLSTDGAEFVLVTTRTAKFLELGDCRNCYRDKRAEAVGAS